MLSVATTTIWLTGPTQNISKEQHTTDSPSPPGATQPLVGVYFTALYRALASSRTRLLDHTQRRATFGRTPLNE